MISFFGLAALAVVAFKGSPQGSFATLMLGGVVYVIVTTGIGLLMSAFTRSQIGAVAGTAILTMLPTVQFSGLTDPVSSLEGIRGTHRQVWPATYFLVISRGTFTKGSDFWDPMGA